MKFIQSTKTININTRKTVVIKETRDELGRLLMYEFLEEKCRLQSAAERASMQRRASEFFRQNL